MTATADLPAKRVVCLPDVIGRSFSDDHCFRVLELWRDGRIVLVVNRQLLVRYLRLLASLGISDSQIRRWILWLTSQDTAVYLPDNTLPECASLEFCAELAKSAGANLVVVAADLKPDAAVRERVGSTVRWVAVAELAAMIAA